MAAVIDIERLHRQAAPSEPYMNEEAESTMDDFLRELDRKVTEIHSTLPHLATKAELLALKDEMKDCMRAVDDRVHAVDKRIGSLKAELLIWGIATILLAVGSAAAVAKFFA
jgi:hypothetical protein